VSARVQRRRAKHFKFRGFFKPITLHYFRRVEAIMVTRIGWAPKVPKIKLNESLRIHIESELEKQSASGLAKDFSSWTKLSKA
jgi:hypothetical protein